MCAPWQLKHIPQPGGIVQTISYTKCERQLCVLSPERVPLLRCGTMFHHGQGVGRGSAGGTPAHSNIIHIDGCFKYICLSVDIHNDKNINVPTQFETY